MVDRTSLLACCADLYELPIVRYLFAQSLHPGGLALTRALAKEINLSKDDHLLDVACGRGTSALMIAQVYKCRVTGIDSSGTATEHARREARRLRLDHLATFVQGDAGQLPFPTSSFTSALCECATNLFPERQAGLNEIGRVLRPGGRLALSDVTFSLKALPDPLDLPLAKLLCIPTGVGPQDFVRFIEAAGLEVKRTSDHSPTILHLLETVEHFLGIRRDGPQVAVTEGAGPSQVAAALVCARSLVQQGDLGYWAFIATKKQHPLDSSAKVIAKDLPVIHDGRPTAMAPALGR